MDAIPYPGLRPYREDEQGKFFGREADKAILVDKILGNRLTLLFAASGVGKSSLLQAAVIPHLKADNGENLSVVCNIDWVSEPLGRLREVILAALREDGTLPVDAHAEAGTLAELLEFCGLFVRLPLVLILDQFEEFFRYQRHNAAFRLFIAQLAEVITDTALPVSVVISMREDFAMELNTFKPQLPTLLFENFYRLEKLSKEQIREVIVKPLNNVGYDYEDGLVDLVLGDLSDEYMCRIPSFVDRQPFTVSIELAYLQIVCSYLWYLRGNSEDRVIKKSLYLSSQRAKGIVGRYLQVKFDDAFKGSGKYVAYRAFDFLVGVPGFKVAYTVEGISNIILAPSHYVFHVLEKLEKMRILRRVSLNGEIWYQLYHDMYSQMIRDWQTDWRASPEYANIVPDIENLIRKNKEEKNLTSFVFLKGIWALIKSALMVFYGFCLGVVAVFNNCIGRFLLNAKRFFVFLASGFFSWVGYVVDKYRFISEGLLGGKSALQLGLYKLLLGVAVFLYAIDLWLIWRRFL